MRSIIILLIQIMLGLSSKSERAEKISFNPEWDGGAPSPHLLQSDHKTFLTYYVNDVDPNWNGKYLKLQNPTSNQPNKIAVVEWVSCHGAVLGGLNDEAISGHRLWKKGLEDCFYGAAIVQNSNWIEEMRKGNSVHPYHKDEMFSDLKHFILLFHDSTFECVAKSYNIEILHKSMPEVLKHVIAKLNS